jgi:hypothetical protein
MTNSSQEPLITRPQDAIIDFSNQSDKSTSTDGFPYPVYWKPKKKYPKVSCIIICCVVSIVSTIIAVCATLGIIH